MTRCRIYDADCLNPTYCDRPDDFAEVGEACRAGDPACAMRSVAKVVTSEGQVSEQVGPTVITDWYDGPLFSVTRLESRVAVLGKARSHVMVEIEAFPTVEEEGLRGLRRFRLTEKNLLDARACVRGQPVESFQDEMEPTWPPEKSEPADLSIDGPGTPSTLGGRAGSSLP